MPSESPSLPQPLLALADVRGAGVTASKKNSRTPAEAVLFANELLLVPQAGGLLAFLKTAFGDFPEHLLVKKVEREPEGRGPHFDAYKDIFSEAHPYVALYNLRGQVRVTTAPLSPELAKAYWEAYPQHSPEAYEARRHFGFVSLTAAGEEARQSELGAGDGFILPLNGERPVVHNVVPIHPEEPGNFIKCVVPKNGKDALEELRQEGYAPLDEFISRAVGLGKPAPKPAPDSTDTRVTTFPPFAPRRRSGRGGRGGLMD